MTRFASRRSSARTRPAPTSNASLTVSPTSIRAIPSFCSRPVTAYPRTAGSTSSRKDYQDGSAGLATGAIGQDQLQDWLANRIKAKRAPTATGSSRVVRARGPRAERRAQGRGRDGRHRPCRHRGDALRPADGTIRLARGRLCRGAAAAVAGGSPITGFRDLDASGAAYVHDVKERRATAAPVASPYRRWWREPRQPGDGRSVAMGEGGQDKGASTEPAIAPVPGRADVLSG